MRKRTLLQKMIRTGFSDQAYKRTEMDNRKQRKVLWRELLSINGLFNGGDGQYR